MYVIQVLCLVGLVVMFLVDKVFGIPQPPLSDYYYAVLAGVGFFGQGVKDFWRK
jgi:uncharacterized membrane protein YuzA (DUF378 family)